MLKEINIPNKIKQEVKKVDTKPLKEDVKVPNTVTKLDPTKKRIPLKEFLIKHKVKILVILGVLLLTGISLFFYFGIYKAKPYMKPDELINLNPNYFLSNSVNTQLTDIPIPTPQEPKTQESPLNGILFTKSEMNALNENRPVAVMINNHEEARPQSGLNSADIVYEALVESGITRYLAIFWSEGPKKVGPIRSARQYYLEWLSPYDALFIYDGCASSTDPKVNACGNIHSYNIKNIATYGAWRWNDGKRYAPHNEYSSILTAWEYAQTKKWDSMPKIDAWEFKQDSLVDQRGTKTKVKIVFHQNLNNSGAYDVVWTYDPKTNSYYKQTGGKTDIDQETNTPVYAKNVVIQETKYTPTYDEKGRIILTTIGEGKATYLRDGKITSGTWKKDSRTGRTIFFTTDGFEVEFNRGRIWITVISRSVGKFDIIEQ